MAHFSYVDAKVGTNNFILGRYFIPGRNQSAMRCNYVGSQQQEKEKEFMPEERREELLTVHEVARHLRVDATTVRRWVKAGALEAITLPHRGARQAYRVKKSTLDTLLNSSLLTM